MEFLVLFVIVVLYQWFFIPILKRKTGYLRGEPTLFYDYKTKWQLPFELLVIALVVICIATLTPVLQFGTVLFIPTGFILILVMRGILEKKYMADMRHHIISFTQAFSIALVFIAILIYAFIQ
ncbi:DUF4181 domain-containing protein [Solibacillus sp. CAU 1738]|uniref:DUF4181 domain-containing protein n=1 Tax=Solibacillus sp. CAU 1738 TaxID=3140363 RepID=UPI0032602790